MLAVWQAADDIDVYESGWTFDHFYPIFSDSTGPCLEGWATLTALAQATRRLRLGTLVTGIHYRHPAVLANMAAALDIISNGRLELGIGAGWNEEESGAYGLDSAPSGALRPLRGSLRGIDRPVRAETASFDGEFYQLKDHTPEPKGPQHPRSASAAVARSARYASPRAMPTTGTSPAVRRRSSPASARCWLRTAQTSGAIPRRSCCPRMSGSSPTSITPR